MFLSCKASWSIETRKLFLHPYHIFHQINTGIDGIFPADMFSVHIEFDDIRASIENDLRGLQRHTEVLRREIVASLCGNRMGGTWLAP